MAEAFSGHFLNGIIPNGTCFLTLPFLNITAGYQGMQKKESFLEFILRPGDYTGRLLVIFAAVGVFYYFNHHYQENFIRAATESRLTWSPPALENPTVIHLSRSSYSLEKNKDYRIVFPNHPVTAPVSISGGRNVVIIGGAINISNRNHQRELDRRMLIISGATGTVHIEGLYGYGDSLAEGIHISAPEATVQIQNVRMEKIGVKSPSELDNLHPDFIQPWGGVGELRVDHFTGASNYQGFMLKSSDGVESLGPVTIKNTNLRGLEGSAYLLWFKHGENSGDVRFENTWLDFYGRRHFGNSIMWAKGDAGNIDNIFRPDEAEDNLGVYTTFSGNLDPRAFGRIYEGTPPGGDFVPKGSVGIGYVSPGYVGSGGNSQKASNSSELPLDLTGKSPEVKSLMLKAFKPKGAVSAKLILKADDPDKSNEGRLFINGFGPVDLFGAQATFDEPGRVELHTEASWWKDAFDGVAGENELRFHHDRTAGFRILDIEVKFIADESTATNNRLPEVDAGKDLTVQAGERVVLSGAAEDPDNDPLSYRWTQVGGTAVSLEGSDKSSATFIAPNVDGYSVLNFILKVSDGTGTAEDETGVTVEPIEENLPLNLEGRGQVQAKTNIFVEKPASAKTAYLVLLADDPDQKAEGRLFINGNGPVTLFGSERTDREPGTVRYQTPASWWKPGANELRFTHDRKWGGYQIRKIEVHF